MTNSRFEYAFGDVCIRPATDSYFAVRIRWSFNRDDMFYRVKFDAAPQKKSIPMDAESILKLQHEAGRIHTLLDVLKTREYILTPEEFKVFSDSLQQIQTKEHGAAPVNNSEKPSVLREIAESRGQSVSEIKPKPGRPRKSRGEEL
jgi:hypothetical protein